MIGAILLKLMAGSGMKEWNQRDLSKILSHFKNDAEYVYPGKMPVSGRWKGKKALEEFFKKYMEQFPDLDFKIKNTCVLLMGLAASRISLFCCTTSCAKNGD